MKTDRILTMFEYLDQWGLIPMRVTPPAGNARHVPIATETNVAPTSHEHACRCDRWGHPCAGCVEERKLRPLSVSNDSSSTTQMR
jgi:hypothetical protein